MYEIDEIFPVIEKAAELSGRTLRQEPRGRRPVPGGRRPRPQRHDADRGRRDPRQRGARLRAAPAAASRRTLHAAARRGGPHAARAAPGQPGQDEAVLPRDRARTGSGSRRSPTPRRTRSGRRCGRVRRSSTWPRGTRSQSGATQLSGSKAFALHDTYGFPIDLTLEMAAEQGLAVDEEGFRRLMTEQRDRAKADAKAKKGKHADAGAYREVADAVGRAVEFTGYDEVVSEAHGPRHRRGLRRGHLGPGGRGGRAGPGPDPVLRRGRRPARRPGRDRARQRRHRPGARRAVADHRADRAPGQGALRRGHRRARTRRRWWTSSGASRSAARTPRPTWCTRRSARRSARPPPRPARRTRRAGSASTSPPAARCPRRRWPTWRRGSTTWSWRTSPVHAEIMTQERGPQVRRDGAVRREVRRRGAGDLGRRLGPRAVRRHARRPLRPARRDQAARASPRSAPAYVGSRRSWAATPTGSWPASTSLVAQLSEALKARPEELPERVNDLVERLRTAEKEIERVRVAAAARGRGTAGEPGQGRLRRRASWGTGPTAPGAGDVRKLALDIRGRMPQGRPGVVAIIGSSNGKPAVVVAVNDEARTLGDLGERAGQGGRGGARRQRRRQGRRRPGWRRRRHATPTRRCVDVRARGRPRGHPALSRWKAPVRRGVRLGVDVGDVRIGVARSRPVRDDRHPGGDGRRAGAATWPGCSRSPPRRRPSRSWSACRARCPGARGRQRRRCASSRPGSRRRWRPVPVRLCDERLSTVTAEAVLRGQGKKGQKRRAVVDQAAAVVILQNALDTERSTGAAPGELVPAGSVG